MKFTFNFFFFDLRLNRIIKKKSINLYYHNLYNYCAHLNRQLLNMKNIQLVNSKRIKYSSTTNL